MKVNYGLGKLGLVEKLTKITLINSLLGKILFTTFLVAVALFAANFAKAASDIPQSIITDTPPTETQTPPGTTEAVKGHSLEAFKVAAPTRKFIKTKELGDFNWGLYGSVPGTAVGHTGAVSYFLNKHKIKYCSPSSEVEPTYFKCENTNVNLEHAELRISSLLEPKAYQSEDEVGAAEDLINNLMVAFPADNLGKLKTAFEAEYSDDKKTAEIIIRQAMINVARNSLNEMMALRMPIQRIPENMRDGATQSKSIMEIMERESTRRFMDTTQNVEWYNAVDESSEKALLKEMLHMEAFRLWMDYYKYRQNERIEALLAVLVSFGIKDAEKVDELISK